MKVMNKKKIRYSVLTAALLVLAFLLMFITACGGEQTETITVDNTGAYSFASIKDAQRYIVEFYNAEDITDGKINEGASYVVRQSVSASAGTSGTFEKVKSMAWGEYVPAVYAILSDNSKSDMLVGEAFIIGGTLTAPKVVLQRDYDQIKVAICDVSLISYFATEAVYGYTAEVFTTSDYSGTPVKTAVFGEDASIIPGTQTTTGFWYRNQYTNIKMDNGKYYVRCKANGKSAALVEDSAYTNLGEITVDGTSSDVSWATATFAKESGMTLSPAIPVGNGSSISSFSLMATADGDAYTYNGAGPTTHMHLVGNASATGGEVYISPLAQQMPVDKPDHRGTWTDNGDGTITVRIMVDYQYYTDEADRRGT